MLKMRVTVRIKVNVTYLRFSCLLPKNPIPRDKCWVKGKTAFLRKLRILGWRWTHVPKSNFQLPRFCWETSLVAQSVKRLPITRETQVWSLGWEDPLEKEMATHSSTLAWKIPWTEECGGLQSMGLQRVRQAIVHGVAKSWTWLSDLTSLYVGKRRKGFYFQRWLPWSHDSK